MSEDVEQAIETNTNNIFSVEGDQDRVLIYVAWLAEIGAELDVTLFVGGLRISGKIASSKEYFNKMSDGFRGASPENENRELPEIIAEGFEKLKLLHEKEVSLATFEPKFIHLTGAVWTQGSTTVTANNVLWRGKISAVDAVVIGKIEQV